MLKELLLLFCGGLAIFALISGTLWASRRSALTFRLTLFWVASLVALAINAAGLALVLPLDEQAVVESVTAYGAALALAWLLTPLYGHRALHRIDAVLFAVGLLGWWGARAQGVGFVVSSLALLPFVLAPLMRPAIAGVRNWRRLTFAERLPVPLLWLMLLHQADYPWLRASPEFAVAGFTMMLFLMLGAAAVLFVAVTERELRKADRRVVDARMVGEDHRMRAEDTEREMARLRQQVDQKGRFELLGNVAAGVAHDFRNLLGLWGGHFELLQRQLGDLSPRQAEVIEGLRRTTGHAERLVDRIVALLRDPVDGEKSPQSVGAAVEAAVQMARGAAPRSLSLQSEINSEALVLAAPGQLEQALLNLIANAIQAHQDHGTAEPVVHVVVREQARPASGSAVVIEVSDNGPGITEELQRRLAQPFVSGRSNGGGLGLGLSIVRSVVDDLQGELSVESVYGQGTCIRLELPCAEEAAERETTPSEQARQAKPMPAERILIVDDEPDIADLVLRAFATEGLAAAVFLRPQEALDWFVEHGDHVDVLLTDQHMPGGLCGEDLAAACRAIRPDLRCVLMTGDRETSIQARENDLFVAVMRKPFRVSALIDLVRPHVRH
ncbi:MAG: response regulator, partial [Candidatus Dadabacteria bacterium]